MKTLAILVTMLALSVSCTQIGQKTDSISGCKHQTNDVCWDIPDVTPTGILPASGKYAAVAASSSELIGPLDSSGFTVSQKNAAGTVFYVHFSTDAYRYDDIDVVGGVFSMAHGGYMDGTVCPTDGYIIYGSFVSGTEAQGHFAYTPGCHFGNEGDFVATLGP